MTQLTFLDKVKRKEPWEEEWQDMPGFTQEKQRPYNAVIVRFETKEDMEEFATLIGQKMTSKTQSLWHPPLQRGKHTHKRYCDES